MVFDRELLINTGPRSIVVETRCQRRIENEVAEEPGDHERAIYDLIRKRYGSYWTNRKPACGVYNCFGMVFASRRTAIRDGVEEILSDDSFRRVHKNEAPSVGDVAIYRDATIGIVHVALITRVEAGAIFAISKWNDCCGEDFHHVQNHCWNREEGYEVDVEFWTDRQ